MRIISIFMVLFILSLSFGSASENKYLHWTTVGDDGNTGICTGYVIKIAYTSDSLQTFWNNCRTLTTVLNTNNRPAGVKDSVLVSLSTFPDGRHYFAIKAFDESGNTSMISNVVDVTIDNIPPSAVQCHF